MGLPPHYLGAGGMTPWQVIDAFNLSHYAASAVEYVLRAGRKTEDPREDLRKAISNLEHAIELETERRKDGEAPKLGQQLQDQSPRMVPSEVMFRGQQ